MPGMGMADMVGQAERELGQRVQPGGCDEDPVAQRLEQRLGEHPHAGLQLVAAQADRGRG